MKAELPERVDRIVIMRALHLGDLLLAVPALRGIRRAFPAAEITLIGLPWAADFVDRFSAYVDRHWEFPGYPGLLEVDHDPERTAAFLAMARDHQIDLAIQMHGSGKASTPFVLELGARCTVGFYHAARPAGLNIGAPYPDGQPEVIRNLGILRLLGLPEEMPRLEFPVRPVEQAQASQLLDAGGIGQRPFAVLHVGARPPARRWFPERFAVVADALARWYDLEIVLTGNAEERFIAQAVRSQMRERALNLAGRTSLATLAAILERAMIFVGNDTGPSHLAVALGTPSVTVFGPADRRRWAPLDRQRHRIVYEEVECSPCPHWECPIDHRCLRRIEPAAVLREAADLLAVAGQRRLACVDGAF